MRNRMGSSLNLDTTVVGLQGLPISTTPPTSGQALVFDGTNWVPTSVQSGPPASVGPTPPTSPSQGDQWFNTDNGVLNVWNGSAWVPVEAVTAIGSVPPTNPADGQLWWDNVSGQLFVWYVDASSSQWVVANVSVGVPGPPGPPGATGPAGPNVMPPGVTDGSNAAAGQVGEYLTSNTILNANPPLLSSSIDLASLAITPGDWQVQGYAQVFISYTGAIIGPGNQWTVGLYTGGSMLAGASAFNAIVYTSTAISNRMGTPVGRINSASPITVTLRVDGSNLQTVGGLTGNFTVSSVLIWARRMR